MAETVAVVNITTHETRTYRFDGVLTQDEVYDEIASGLYDPESSKVHYDDVDIAELLYEG